MINSLEIILPEISVIIMIMTMQIWAIFTKKSERNISSIYIAVLIIITGGLIYYPISYGYYGKSFLTSSVMNLFKAVILALTIMSLFIYRDFVKIAGQKLKMEFMTLIMLSTLGVFISISARDLLLLFCGLELQALAGYALAAFNTRDEKSSEAGLKYFILGALMSAIMLMGMSFLYGFSGSINFADIKYLMASKPSIGLICGVLFIAIAILFKLSAAPFHIWTPDVYEGAPISSVSYFATAPKIGMLVVLINILDGVVGGYEIVSQELVKIVSICSMLIGAFGAIGQTSLKRLMAYSTISNMGYALMAVSLYSVSGNNVAYIYLLIYAIGAVGLFASLVALFGDESDNATFDDLKGAAYHRKALSAAIAVIAFSMIGLPPFAGFFGKYYVFLSALQSNELLLVIIGVISSVISAFYYLKIVKHLYFFKPLKPFKKITTKKGLWLVTTISVTFTIFFFAFAYKYIV